MVGNSLLVGVGSSIKNSHKRKKTYTISPHQTYSLWLANRLALSEVRLLWFMHMVIMIYCCIHFCNYNHIKFTSISPSITYHYTVSKNMTSNLACIIWVNNIIINRQMNNPPLWRIKYERKFSDHYVMKTSSVCILRRGLEFCILLSFDTW